MTVTATANSNVRAIPSFVEMTPFQIYLRQVQASVDTIRANNIGYTYMPPQLGGLIGQLDVLNQNIVLQLIDFKVD
jgi:hypothetical protein